MQLATAAATAAGRARTLAFGVVLAGALPCAALVWPGAIPREVALLALIPWAGILAVALCSSRGS
jgi:hypothetical protein